MPRSDGVIGPANGISESASAHVSQRRGRPSSRRYNQAKTTHQLKGSKACCRLHQSSPWDGGLVISKIASSPSRAWPPSPAAGIGPQRQGPGCHERHRPKQQGRGVLVHWHSRRGATEPARTPLRVAAPGEQPRRETTHCRQHGSAIGGHKWAQHGCDPPRAAD